MAVVECPIDGCGYEDDVAGVEAHISGSTDNSHSGESGWNYREALRNKIEAAHEQPDEQQVEDDGDGRRPSDAGMVVGAIAVALAAVMGQ